MSGQYNEMEIISYLAGVSGGKEHQITKPIAAPIHPEIWRIVEQVPVLAGTTVEDIRTLALTSAIQLDLTIKTSTGEVSLFSFINNNTVKLIHFTHNLRFDGANQVTLLIRNDPLTKVTEMFWILNGEDRLHPVRNIYLVDQWLRKLDIEA